MKLSNKVSDITSPGQQFLQALRAFRDTPPYPSTYEYIREAYEEQAIATRALWEELGQHLQEAIHSTGNAATKE